MLQPVVLSRRVRRTTCTWCIRVRLSPFPPPPSPHSREQILVKTMVSKSLKGESNVMASLKRSPKYEPKTLPSRMYSGYVRLEKGHNMHYIFVESENNPAEAPVILWVQGGPGASSLEGMFFEVHEMLQDLINRAKRTKWHAHSGSAHYMYRQVTSRIGHHSAPAFLMVGSWSTP